MGLVSLPVFCMASSGLATCWPVVAQRMLGHLSRAQGDVSVPLCSGARGISYGKLEDAQHFHAGLYKRGMKHGLRGGRGLLVQQRNAERGLPSGAGVRLQCISHKPGGGGEGRGTGPPGM